LENSLGGLPFLSGLLAPEMTLLCNYAASFVTAANGHGGTLIAEASQMAQQGLLTQPHAGAKR